MTLPRTVSSLLVGSLALALTVLSPLAGRPATAAAARILSDSPGYLEAVLENGLRVVLLERREVPMVCFTAVAGAGSALESEDFSGASHFLEHLLFNGTSTMNQEELYDAVDRIGGYNNAGTGEDATTYTMLVPTAAARQGLEIQAAMLFDSTLPADKLEKERKIVLEELAKDLATPGESTRNGLRRALAPTSAWGRPVIGTESSLAGIGLKAIRDYYERQYVPDNVVLLVAGDFDTAAMLAEVEEVYGGLPRGGDVAAVTDPFADTDGGTWARVAVADDTTSLALALPAPGPCEPGGREAAVLADVLGSEAGPLRRAVGQDRASRLSVGYQPRPVGSGLRIDVELTGGTDPTAVVGDLLEALARTGRGGLGPNGVDPVAVLRVARAARSQRFLMGQRIHYLGMLAGESIAACPGELSTLLDEGRAAEIDPAAVAAVASDLLADASSVVRVAVAGPATDGPQSGPLPEFPTAAVALVSEPEAQAGGAGAGGADLDRTLDNGLRVLIRQEDRALVTGFHVLVENRTAREPAGREGIADLLHRMLPLGTALSDRSQVSARLERIGADLKTADSDFIPYDDYYTSPTHSFIRLEVPSANWLPALDLLAELVRVPRLDADDFATLRAARVERAKKDAVSPVEQGRRTYRRTLLGADHPQAKPLGGSPESLEAVSAEELQDFFVDYFDPAGMILSVVGAAEPEDLLGAVVERFSGPSPGAALPSVPPWPLTGSPGPEVVRELGTEQARVYFGRIAELAAEDRPALRLLAGLLSDRLVRTIREEQGLSYRLGASVNVAVDRGWLTVTVGTRPENVAAVVAGVAEQMERLRQEMADSEEIDRLRAVQGARALMRSMTAVNRARGLALEVFTGLPSGDDPVSIEALGEVDRDELEQLAEKWLDPKSFQVVIVR